MSKFLAAAITLTALLSLMCILELAAIYLKGGPDKAYYKMRSKRWAEDRYKLTRTEYNNHIRNVTTTVLVTAIIEIVFVFWIIFP